MDADSGNRCSKENVRETNKDDSLLQECLADKCDIDKQDEVGKTVLFYLFLNYGKDLARQIYSKNPNVNIPDFDGTYPIHVLSKTKSEYVLTALKELMEHDPDIRATDKYGRTCLHIAAFHNCHDVVKLLLEYGCDIEALDAERNTALHYAAMRTDQTGKLILKLLHAKGAHLNKQNIYKKSLLQYVSSRYVLQFFLSKLENLNHVNDDGKTVLHYACSYCSIDEVKLLIEKGADVNALDSQGRNALIYGCKEGSVEMVQYIITKTETINLQDHMENTALHYACKRKDEGLQQAICLIDSNISLDLQNVLGKTALMVALEAQMYETVEYLLHKNANVNMQDYVGRTPLHYAVLYRTELTFFNDSEVNSIEESNLQNSVQMIKRLVEEGAKTNIEDQEGMTPLHYACMTQGNYHLAEILTEFNANIMSRDNHGKTPVHMAANCGDFKTLHVLLLVHQRFSLDEKRIPSLFDLALKSLKNCLMDNQKKKISSTPQALCVPSKSDFHGHRFYCSINNQDQSFIELVLKQLPDITLSACYGNTVRNYVEKQMTNETAELFVSCGMVTDAVNSNGRTALHHAAEKGNVSVIHWLVKNGCDINETDYLGFTPLFLAVFSQQKHAVKALLNLGASIKCSDSFGKTVFHYAASGGRNEILKLLLMEGTIHIGDGDGRSPLHIACENNNFEAIYYILQNENGKTLIDLIDKKSGKGVLHSSSEKGQRKTVYILSLHGANLDLKTSQQSTALHLAVQNKHESVVLLLLHHGADVNVQDGEGQTPLHIATQADDYRITRVLLRHNASKDICNKFCQLPIQCTNSQPIKSLLQTHDDFAYEEGDAIQKEMDIVDNKGVHRIYYNICLLEFTVRHLVSGETVYILSQLGNTTICYIKKHFSMKKLQALKFLVYDEQSVNNETSSCDGLVKYAYLALTSKLGHLCTINARNCFDLFLEVAKVEEKYNLPSSTRDDVIQDLLKSCEDFHKMFVVGKSNTRNLRSSTFFFQRIDNDNENQTQTGRRCVYTDTGTTSSTQNNAHTKKIFQNKITLCDLLEIELRYHGYIKEIAISMRIGDEIHEYVKERKWHKVDAYLRKQNSPNIQNKDGWTPLHLSILYGFDEYVLLLLKNNADVNILTKDVTPISLFYNNSKPADRKYFRTISPLLLATLLDRQNIARLLAQENVSENDLEMCLELSFGEQIEAEILEGLCRRISRKFANISLQVYPGYRQANPLKRTLLGLSSDIFQTTNLNFSSLELLMRNPKFYDENEDRENDNETDISSDDCEMLKRVIAKYSSRLWQCHSLLNVITGALIVRSNAEEKTRPCIVVYTSIKDFIPLHERSFPSKLQIDDVEYELIIREGRAVLGPMDPQIKCLIPFNKIMRMGSPVGRLGGESGTMGPVVNIGENGIGFISCAHIFFDKEIREHKKLQYDEATTSLDEKISVVQPTDEEIYVAEQNYEQQCNSQQPEIFRNQELRVCGKVIKAVFDPEHDPSIDAALIHITQTERCPKDGSFTAVSLRNLENAGFKSQPSFFTGKTLQYIPNNTFGAQGVVSGEVIKGGSEVVKVGATTEITIGAVAFDGLQAKLTTDSKLSLYCCESYCKQRHCSHQRIEFIMKGQYEIRSSKQSKFFDLGDSGAGVFTVDRKHNNELTCVGIAVGVLPGGNAIVTPIEPVLSALGNVQLKQFSSATKRRCDFNNLRKDTQEDVSAAKRLKQ